MPKLTGTDEETAEIMRKRKAALAQETDDSPAPGTAAASPRDAGKAAWDFGHDFDGGSHRGGAELEAIKVFADNLKDLLLAAPAGPRATSGSARKASRPSK